MSDIVSAISLAQDRNTARLTAELAAPPPDKMTTEAVLHLRRFSAFCKARGIRFCPCAPASVAAYIRAEVGADIHGELILEALAAIEEVHDQGAFPNPVVTGMVRREISLIPGLIEKAPRSWPKEERPAFWLLNAKAREVILRRDRDASKTLRRAQNETAELRKQLQSLQPKEIDENAEV